jgi:DNA polymerase-1
MTLYLVDGHALAYRSYFAFIRQPLVNSRGEETSAVFGFLNTVLGMVEKYEPRYLAVVFDSVGKTFRHEKYAEYKANRVEIPDSLAAQIPVIFAVLRAMNVPQLSIEGFEADDLIATLARRFESAMPVRVVSGDKDLLQLVNDRIHVIRPGRTNVLEEEITPEGVKALFGLGPEQIVDYLALRGDSSDNVPGVRGVGRKTALQLLQAFGTMDAVYENLDSLEPPSVRQKLADGRADARLSRELVVLDTNVPIEVDLPDLARGELRTPQFEHLLEELEFVRMHEQLFGAAAAKTEAGDVAVGGPPIDGYRVVDTLDALRMLAIDFESADEFAVDVETSSLDPMRAVLAGVALSRRPGEAHYVPVRSRIDAGTASLIPEEESPGLPLEALREALGPLFRSRRPAKIGQNIKYDAIVLDRAGMPLSGIGFDTMIASYCLDPGRKSHGLDSLALEFCGHDMIPFKALFDARVRGEKDIRRVPLAKVGPYACEDADYTLRLKHVFQKLLEASQVLPLFRDVEMPLEEVLTRMEMTGVTVDTAFLGSLSTRYTREIGELEERIYGLVGERFNINSTAKLREVLFDKLGLKPARKTKTGYSTDVDVLSGLAGQHEVPRLLLDYRQLVKLKSTYVDALPRLVNPDTGRVHTSYNQAVTTTGRLSSSDPNLQNIPVRTPEGREIRRAFVSSGAGWVLLDADYSQIELRILAHLSGDRELITAFQEGADVHRRTAARIMQVAPDQVTDEMRSRAKTVNFGIVYGMGARGLAQSLDIDVDEARRFIDDYFRLYPGVKRFVEETIARAREQKAVTTLLGRTRQLPDIGSSDGRVRSFSERIAVNTPVQGTAADIIKLAMLRIDAAIREGGLRSKMILQVHDELLFDTPESEVDTMKRLVRDNMESAVRLRVPLRVDMGVGVNWLEAH